jgi:hypothetical protein
VTAGLRDDRDCLRLTATRESTSLINAVTGHVKSDQIHLSGNATNQACGLHAGWPHPHETSGAGSGSGLVSIYS